MRRGKNKGFSLVELIIVIAIMAVLVGVLTPQFLRYVSKARESTCETNCYTIVKDYQLAMIEKQQIDKTTAENIVQDIIEGYGGTKTAGAGYTYTGGAYSGICQEHGVYNCILSTDLEYMSITCSEHGTLVLDVQTLAERLENIKFDNKTYKDVAAYFSVADERRVDSEAVGTGGSNNAYGEYGSFAAMLNANLVAQGIGVQDRSWCMYNNKNTNEYEMYLTEKKITSEDIGKGTIACDVYDLKTNTVVHGTVEVTWSDGKGTKYPVINRKTFKPTEGE